MGQRPGFAGAVARVVVAAVGERLVPLGAGQTAENATQPELNVIGGYTAWSNLYRISARRFRECLRPS